jgi:hypothetical protein
MGKCAWMCLSNDVKFFAYNKRREINWVLTCVPSLHLLPGDSDQYHHTLLPPVKKS